MTNDKNYFNDNYFQLMKDIFYKYQKKCSYLVFEFKTYIK